MRKFAFDTEFSADGRVVKASAPAAGPKRLTPEELEAERAAAYARGKDDALAVAERANAKALTELAAATTALLKQMEGERAAMRTEAIALALIAARKIAGSALDAFGEERTLGALEAMIEGLRDGPRLVVRVPAVTAAAITPRIEALRADHHYAGAIVVRPDPGLQIGAVQIDWADGVVTIDPAEIAGRVEALMQAALTGAGEGESL
jgi:flagellar assembly protein FliH